MLIDQAGDADSNKSRNSDPWAMAIFGVEPFIDDLGQSKIFILDLWVEVAGESEAIEQAVRMYINAGVLSCIGVEKVGQTTTHIHIANALSARGRHVEFSDDRGSTGILLRPAGRNKKKFIESALAWPLNNSKWFYSSEVRARYVDRLKQEMTNFPLWHDDTLNVCAYLYDILRDYHFSRRETPEEARRRKFMELVQQKKNENYDGLRFGLSEDSNDSLRSGLGSGGDYDGLRFDK
jgi:hypothetical protein